MSEVVTVPILVQESLGVNFVVNIFSVRGDNFDFVNFDQKLYFLGEGRVEKKISANFLADSGNL